MLAFLVGCASPKPPTIDGVVNASEWAGARVERVEDVTIRFRHDSERLYISIERPQPMGFACVLVAREGVVRVLHASAKLGSATYVDGKPASKDYVWRDAATMQREEGWHATTMKSPAMQEFAIDRDKLGPIAISFYTPSRTIGWPAGLNDGAANLELVAGFNPDGLTFETAKWITVVR